MQTPATKDDVVLLERCIHTAYEHNVLGSAGMFASSIALLSTACRSTAKLEQHLCSSHDRVQSMQNTSALEFLQRIS